MARPLGQGPKAVRWVGGSRDDLSSFPAEVRRRMGGALWEARTGGKALYVKPLRGFGGSGVLEIVDDFDGDTYRAVYTVRFAKAVYVLHAFQKKSKRGCRYAQIRTGFDRATAQASGRGSRAMVKKREAEIPVTESTGTSSHMFAKKERP